MRAAGGGAAGGKTAVKVVWKVMRLKHLGPAIREWRAVHAIRASGGSGDFAKVVHRDLLADILRPPKGSLPSGQQVSRPRRATLRRVAPGRLCALQKAAWGPKRIAIYARLHATVWRDLVLADERRR